VIAMLWPAATEPGWKTALIGLICWIQGGVLTAVRLQNIAPSFMIAIVLLMVFGINSDPDAVAGCWGAGPP
jgi:hypothetical protein